MSARRHQDAGTVAVRRRLHEEAKTATTQQEYRRQRKRAYRLQLGEDASEIDTLGDVLDAVIKAIYGDRSELDQMAAKIAIIKQSYPKPQ